MRRILFSSWQVVMGLGQGLAVTLGQLFRKPCTVQYPKERLIWPQRSRGRLVLPRTREGRHKCTSCLMCQRACPNGTIAITFKTGDDNKRALVDFLYALERCTFCGLCVEACPFDALRMSHAHELAAYDRNRLTLHLQEEKIPFHPAWRGGLSYRAELPPAAGSGQAHVKEGG
ncbi:NADH-quinone oxidoreductase subunit I [candidate division FCPU426 bacterium]|nr:NADH-quinone oxidoreductase subunit I [candidate division FCPU426 bacterium]